jgi:hypothetical protein
MMEGSKGMEMGGITARGGKELKKHLSGQKLTQRRMILAKCYDCMGGFIDGKMDCRVSRCPLYPLMPYRDKPKTPPL